MSASAEDRNPRDVLIDALDSWIRPDAAADVALAALRAAGYVVEQGWQDISTAPRDGTTIDVWRSRRFPSVAWRGRYCGFCYYGTIDGDSHEQLIVVSNPTHWRPLPAPPDST